MRTDLSSIMYLGLAAVGDGLVTLDLNDCLQGPITGGTIKALHRRGLIELHPGGWELTDAGGQELQAADGVFV